MKDVQLVTKNTTNPAGNVYMLSYYFIFRGRCCESGNLMTGRSVVRTRHPPLDFPCLGLGNLAVSQLPRFLRGSMAAKHQKGVTTERFCNLGVLRDRYFAHIHASRLNGHPSVLASAYSVTPGFEPRTSDMPGERVNTTPPTHANVFTLERCDWCARLIEGRSSNCPRCDDRLSRQSGRPTFGSNTLDRDGGGLQEAAQIIQTIKNGLSHKISEIHSFANKFGFAIDSSEFPTDSLVCGVSRQLYVLHQAVSCSSCFDIGDIAMHVYL
ncbi:hypothetical protein CSKR_113070 [Clonorchis sinensis]|uniref:Uncharacterized protein n=1 Tax=Clonorchis sinensis TaxID=79923 RepID=A0A3R7FNN0_CLOSI|nr:hypothetical protein CSKR_113070 [Clonorchis sinensis]